MPIVEKRADSDEQSYSRRALEMFFNAIPAGSEREQAIQDFRQAAEFQLSLFRVTGEGGAEAVEHAEFMLKCLDEFLTRVPAQPS